MGTSDRKDVLLRNDGCVLRCECRICGRVPEVRKIVEGGTDQSYGIHVAQLAGLPVQVIERAREILATLEESGPDTDGIAEAAQTSPTAHKLPADTEHSDPIQLSLFGSKADDLVDEVNAIDITNMTPLQALNKLQELKKKYTIKINTDTLDNLSVSAESDEKAIDLYTVKKGGLIPRTPYPTIDADWANWE